MSRTAVWIGFGVQVVPLAAAAMLLTSLGALRWSGIQLAPPQGPLLIGVAIAYLLHLLARAHGPFGIAAMLVFALLVGVAGGRYLPEGAADTVGNLFGEVGPLLLVGLALGRWRRLGTRLPQSVLSAAGWIYIAGWILLALRGWVETGARIWSLLGLALFTLLSMVWSSRLSPERGPPVAQSAGDLYLLALNLTIARLVLFALG